MISGTSSADSIYNNNYYVTINAAAGNDTIYNYFGYRASINTGSGDDSIYNYGSDYSTINAGKGDDSIDVIQYATGDGNDTIVGFDEDDTLHITSGTYSTTKSGDDFIVNVGSGSITFKNPGYTPIQVRDANGQMRVINYQ